MIFFFVSRFIPPFFRTFSETLMEVSLSYPKRIPTGRSCIVGLLYLCSALGVLEQEARLRGIGGRHLLCPICLSVTRCIVPSHDPDSFPRVTLKLSKPL